MRNKECQIALKRTFILLYLDTFITHKHDLKTIYDNAPAGAMIKCMNSRYYDGKNRNKKFDRANHFKLRE